MKLLLRRRHLLVIALALAAGLTVWLVPRKLHQESLPERDDLPAMAKAALHGRMRGHGDELSELSLRVVLLDYQGAIEVSERVRSNARLSRPLTGDATELNARLPERFFTLQDELVTRTSALADAARSHDAETLADAYGAVMRTCVRCHATYLSR